RTIPSGNDRRHFRRREILRSRFLYLSRGCRRGLAGAVARVALSLHSRARGLSRAQRRSRQSAGSTRSHEHAFGQESVFDAHEKPDRRRVSAILASDARTRSAGDRGLSAEGTKIAAGILAVRTGFSARAPEP